MGGGNRPRKSQRASRIFLNTTQNSRRSIPKKLMLLASEQCLLKVQEDYLHRKRATENDQDQTQCKVIIRQQETEEQNSISIGKETCHKAEQFWAAGDIWQDLEALWVVTTREAILTSSGSKPRRLPKSYHT